MTTPGALHVFIGPSLPPDEVATLVPDAVVHPPAAQGDVLRALHERPGAIAIVDGYFEAVPAVWHKEILVALSSGVAVHGAASMGALRAAELDRFGMVGHGTVYEWFRDGVLSADDEVAVAHASADEGYRSLSVALVDLRDLYARARDAGVIDAALHDRLVAAARALPYPERHHRRVAAEVVAANVLAAGPAREALDAFVAGAGPGLKARDARSLLAHLAACDLTGPDLRPEPVRVEPTVFLHRLHNEVALERAAGRSPLAPEGEPLAGLDTRAVLHKKVLARLLARRLAALEGIPVDDDDLADALARFRAEFALSDDEEFAAWRAANAVGDGALVEFLRDWVVLDKLQRLHADDVERLAPDHLRIATARLHRAAAHPGTADDASAV